MSYDIVAKKINLASSGSNYPNLMYITFLNEFLQTNIGHCTYKYSLDIYLYYEMQVNFEYRVVQTLINKEMQVHILKFTTFDAGIYLFILYLYKKLASFLLF